MDSLHNCLGNQQSCNSTATGPPLVPHIGTSDTQQHSHSINHQIILEVQATLFETQADRGDHNSHQESLRVVARETRFPALGEVFLWRTALPLQRHHLMVLEDSQEILVEQSLPVKNYAILGAGRDIYSQHSLNRHNS